MQHRILIQVLKEATKKMSAAREEHNKASESFSKVAKHIPALIRQSDFVEKRDYLDKQVQSHREDYKMSSMSNEFNRWNNGISDYLRNRLARVTKSHKELKDII